MGGGEVFWPLLVGFTFTFTFSKFASCQTPSDTDKVVESFITTTSLWHELTQQLQRQQYCILCMAFEVAHLQTCTAVLTLLLLSSYSVFHLANVVSARTLNLEDNVSSAGPSLSSFQQAMTMVTMTTHQPAHKSTSEEMDSEGRTIF